jgi:large-conductance mechanosensitive channel
MSAAGNTFWSDRADARKWIGRMVMAVIFGEAIWHLIASVMDYVVVPWLGDVMGQSSGLPTSFTQRPYDYPDLFVSVVEFCIAAIVAISINWYFQRPGKPVRVQARPAAVAVPQAVTSAPPVVPPQPSMVAPAEPEFRPVVPEYRPVATAPPVVAPARVAAPPPPKPAVVAAPPPPPVAPKPQVAPSAPAPAVAKSIPAPVPTSQPAKAQPDKKKEVYYNIVGDPVSDDD